MTRKRVVIVVAVVVAVVTGGLVVRSRGGASEERGGDVIVFAPVERRTLQDVLTVNGEVRHEEIGTLNMLAPGRVTGVEVDDGDRVQAGDTVFAVDGRPAIAAQGDFPFWRPLEDGAVGFDVLQLEEILASEGYDPGPVDLDFTAATRSALVRWQRDRGYSATEKEPDETVTFQLQSGKGYDVGRRGSAGGTIVEAAGGTPPARAGIARGRARPMAPGDPTVSIAASPTRVAEGEASRFIITSDLDPPADVTVTFTLSGTAAPGSDYDALAGQAKLEVGESRVEVVLSTFDDAVLEPDETVIATVQAGAGYNVGPSSSATVTIVDGTIPELTITPTEVSVNEGGTATVTIVSDQPLKEDTQVQLSVGGSATGGDPADPDQDQDVDYVEIEEPVLMPAGATQVEIDVATVADSIIEIEEDVTIEIQEAQFPPDAYEVGAVFEATVTILDDPDDLPTLSIRADDDRTTEGQAAGFVVESDFEVTGDLTVSYVVWGTVTPDQDYPEPSGELSFANDDETTLDVSTKDDDLVEPDEALAVTLLPGDGYRLGAASSATVLVESDDLPELDVTGGGKVVEGGTLRFTITADQPPAEDTAVSFSVGGTAQAGADFEALEGVVLLRAGADRIDVEVVTIDDDAVFQPGDFVVGEWPTRIGSVLVDLGEFVPEGNPLMTLTEDELTVTIEMSPSDRAELDEGLRATVELAATGVTAPAVIEELEDAPDVDQSGGETYAGTVTVEGDLAVVDGATVSVDVVLEESVDVVTVPVAALVGVGDETEVRVVRRDGSLERVAVVTGLTEGAFVEIREGLSGGEQVVVEVDPA